MQNAKFSYEPWTITERGFQADHLRENESVFALANGLIGMRGNLEEKTASGADTIQGTFVNGIFDSEPIIYGEAAYGYAKNHETICNVMDAKSLLITADGEKLDMGSSNISEHVRTLDMRLGTLHRSFIWKTARGAVLRVSMDRIVSLQHQHIAAAKLRISCVSGSSRVDIESPITPATIAAGDPNDPRNAGGKDRSLKIGARKADGTCIAMQQFTKNSGLVICCAAEHVCAADGMAAGAGETGSSFVTENGTTWITQRMLFAGDTLDLEKKICYTAGKAAEADTLFAEAVSMCRQAPAFAQLAADQRAYLDAFWEGAGMSIEGDDALLQGLRFNLFHILQSAGRDGLRSVCAKGLSGEGYEGHYFWDTEAYVVPVFLHTHPDIARKLLEYRYSILPNARARARVLGHEKGALYAWRTIDGEECSAYFPAGTAQYHIDGDIAHAIADYYYTSGDLEFMARYGTEMLVETARLFYDLGFFSQAKGGRFVINCVTGPDEYNVLVNNNTYTNRIAAENLRNAAAFMRLLEEKCPEDYARICQAAEYDPQEAADWEHAADLMYYPEAEDGIYPQDDEFLHRKPWPLDSIPADKRPLLIHYHGLTIYRHMISKQADMILAMVLFGDQYTLEEKKKNFAFYDSVTTHDSSLSMAIFSILASEIGDTQTAYDYFMSSARLDLDDMQGNSKDGLHLANMAGTWNCMTKGFGGMRYTDGTISFAPVCPPQWQGYSFRVMFRGRTIEVKVSREGAQYTLIDGEPIEIIASGSKMQLA